MISGKGLFADEHLAPGTVVAIWPVTKSHIVIEEQALERMGPVTPKALVTLCRIFGDFFVYHPDGKMEPEERVNHSSSPNLLHFSGVLITNRSVEPNEELTLDYKYLCSSSVPEKIGDELIVGMNRVDCIMKTLTELYEIVSKSSNSSRRTSS